MSFKTAEAALTEAIRILSEARSQIRTGQVKTVNKDDLTCTVYDELREITYHDVRLRPVIGGESGIYGIPTADSNGVVALFNNKEEAMILLGADEYTEFVVYIGASTLVISNDGFEFNGGDNGGLVNIETLKDSLDKSKEILDIFLNTINGTTIYEAGNGAPSSLQATLKSALAGKQTADHTDIEDDLITH